MPLSFGDIRQLVGGGILALVVTMLLSFPAPLHAEETSQAAEVPGTSFHLYFNPYYTCKKNIYVSTTGSDQSSGSEAAPFKTLQRANNSLPTGGAAAGTCVIVMPGKYTAGVLITAGGNQASSTGYVVYRCAKMSYCTVTDVSAGGQNGSFVFNAAQSPMASYVMIDGFRLKAARPTTYGQGVELWAGSTAFGFSSHHVWILNSIVAGYGQSGLQMNAGEYFFAIHNVIYGNANAGCAAQGSGISFAGLIALPHYTPTPDDLNNKVYGQLGSGFHNAVEWNVVYNNAITQCGTAAQPYDTDGNNIIMDTLNWAGVKGAPAYTQGVLIAFNIVYNSGGGGIHLFNSGNITVANNSCNNTYLDPYNNGSYRPCIDSAYGSNKLINNIAVAIPSAHSGPGGACQYTVAPYTQWNYPIGGAPPTGQPADTFSHNITLAKGNSTCTGTDYILYQADVGQYSCSNNKCGTNPNWVNVGITSLGTETINPTSSNFALRLGSLAIGYGLTETYLSPQSADVGACYHTIIACPAISLAGT